MKLLSLSITLLLIATAPMATAQSTSQLKRELRQRESAAGEDLNALVELAEWAKEKGLIRDRRRLLQSVLKADPDHEGANVALGMARFDGKWMPKAKAEEARRKALAAEMKAKGMVEVEGVWVTEEEVEDAKKGIFRHDGEEVSANEKLALVQGMVRHPRTGEFVAESDFDKADSGMFPLGDGQWGDLKQANDFHARAESPWVVRTYYAWVVSNRPLEELEGLSANLDSGIEAASRIFQGAKPRPTNRPVIWVAKDNDQYLELGNQIGAEGSAYAVFLAQAELRAPQLGELRPVISNFDGNGDGNWGPYWIRHAGGLAYAASMAEQAGIEAPLWFLRGVAGYAERHYSPGVAAHFGKQHLQKGGVKDVASWLQQFKISPDLQPRMLDFNVFQAGLVLDFAMSAKSDSVTEAMLAVTKAFADEDAKGGAKALSTLEKAVGDAEEELRNHLKDVIQKG